MGVTSKDTNAFKEPRVGPWLQTTYGDKPIFRRVRFQPGYDCRTKCEHDPPGKHGAHGDSFSLEARTEDGTIGVTLSCSTLALAGRALWMSSESSHWHGPVRPSYVHRHASFPYDEEHLRAEPSECDLVAGGLCYSSEGLILAATDIWQDDDTRLFGDAAFHPYMEEMITREFGAWDRLFDYLLDVAPSLKKRRDELPTLCAHCRGTGMIARGQTNG